MRVSASIVIALLAGATSVCAQEKGTPTFSKDVAPILFNQCASCHRPGEAAPFPLLTYQDAKKRGKLIAQVTQYARKAEFRRRIVFIEDYDVNVCRHLIQGVDVWLNNPRRPLEASGTSGQKAVLNGALNLSILDGWWAEAYDGGNGFAISKGTSHVNEQITDTRDGQSLYEVLEKQVVPLYYDRDIDGLPRQWIKRMVNSISSLAWRFSAQRMVGDYVRSCYLPAAGGMSCDMSVR